jgi:hypothetical protein
MHTSPDEFNSEGFDKDGFRPTYSDERTKIRERVLRELASK